MGAFKSLKSFFASKLVGVGEDRIEVRTQGCWSCIHWDAEKAANLWWNEARTRYLSKAIAVAIKSPLGENDPTARNIRAMVPATDACITKGEFGCCSKGKQPNGDPVGDFVAHTFLCGVWTGRVGASVAREGQAPDKLPEELMEQLQETKPEDVKLS